MSVAVLLAALQALAGACSQTVPRTLSLGGKAMWHCTLPQRVQAVRGVLSLPEDRALPRGRQIELRVAVLPATGSAQQDAVFFLAGGPGGSAIEAFSTAASAFRGLNASRDIVLVDQRGTGGSHLLQLPEPTRGEALPEYARRALAGLDGDGRFYTTSVAMDDLDAVRSALGYRAVDLYGASYGATAVQYYLKQHGDHVRTAVLDGGSLLDVPLMELTAASSQRALDDVLGRCQADAACRTAYPAVAVEFAAVLHRLAAAPIASGIVDPSTGRPLLVTADLFAGVIHNRLLTASAAARIPWLIHRAAAGDVDGIASDALANRTPSTAFLLMSWEIRCSEAWARFDPDHVRSLGAGSYYGPSQLASAEQQAAACPLLPKGVVAPDDDQPVRTGLPVLLLNGADDPQDPPANVAGAAGHMPNSLVLTVPGQGHTVGTLGCLPSVVVDFIDTGRIDRAAGERCLRQFSSPPFYV